MAKKSWARRKRPKKTIGKCLKSNSIWTHWIHMTHAYNSLDQCQQANEYISGRFDVYFILACKRKWWAYTTEYNLCYTLMFLIYHGRNADPFINKWIFFRCFSLSLCITLICIERKYGGRKISRKYMISFKEK